MRRVRSTIARGEPVLSVEVKSESQAAHSRIATEVITPSVQVERPVAHSRIATEVNTPLVHMERPAARSSDATGISILSGGMAQPVGHSRSVLRGQCQTAQRHSRQVLEVSVWRLGYSEIAMLAAHLSGAMDSHRAFLKSVQAETILLAGAEWRVEVWQMPRNPRQHAGSLRTAQVLIIRLERTA